MPLPRKYASPLYTVSEESGDFEHDQDDILSMLEKKNPTSRPKSATSSSLAETERSKGMSRIGSSETTKYNFQTSNNDNAASSKQLETVLVQLKHLNNDVQQIHQMSAEQADVIGVKLENYYSNLDESISTALLDSQTSIISRISTSQSKVSDLCRGIEQLKNWAESTHHRSGNLSELIESLLSSVTKHNEDLVYLTASFKIASKTQMEQKESLNSLKRVSIENKSLLEDMWASYEKDSLLLRKEQEAMLAEKEKMAQARISFEKAEALFEQRKASFV